MSDVPSEEEVLEMLYNPVKEIPVQFVDKKGRERKFMAEI